MAEKPKFPVFDTGPKYSDYVPNAYMFSPEELANKNAEYKRDYAVYEQGKAEIMKNYQLAIENYYKEVQAVEQQEALNKQAQSLGYKDYDAYRQALVDQVKAREQAKEQQKAEIERRIKAGVPFSVAPIPQFMTPIPGLEVPIKDTTPFYFTKDNKAPSGIGLESGLYGIRSEISQLKTKLSITGDLSPEEYARYYLLSGIGGFSSALSGLVNLPKAVYHYLLNPKELKEIPGSIRKAGLEFGELLRISPGEAVFSLGGNLLFFEYVPTIGDVFKTIKTQLIKLTPKYLGEAKAGSVLNVVGKDGQVIPLRVVAKIPKESLASQVSKAGQTLDAISSQKGFFDFFNRERVVRKPIPNEELLSPAVRSQLKRFDEGKLSLKEIVKLDRDIKGAGIKIGFGGKAKGLLERVFFADPTGKIRPSRLGIISNREANLLDLLYGDISFKTPPKPQILLFEKIKVADFPNYLKPVANKISKGGTLTGDEWAKFLEWQLKKTGEFKPVGFLTRESEITLAPGELIKKVRVAGRTIIKGEVIPIIQAEVFKPVGEIKNLLNKALRGKLKTLEEINKLDKLLLKETGINYGLSYYAKGVKYINPSKLGVYLSYRLSKGYNPKSNYSLSGLRYITYNNLTSKTSPKIPGLSYAVPGSPSYNRRYIDKVLNTPYSPPGLSKPPYYPKTGKYPPRYPPKYPPKFPPGYPPSVPPRYDENTDTMKYTKEKKRFLGYIIFEKIRGKFRRIPGLPLSLKNVKDRLAYRLDNRLSRSARILPVATNILGTITEKEFNYFDNFKGLREYKIRKGQKIPTPLSFIEKRAFGLSTRSEVKQIQALRDLSSRKLPPKTNNNFRQKKQVSFISHGRKVSFETKR